MVPLTVLKHYGLTAARLTPIVAGHLNATYLVDHRGARCVMQRVNPIFGTEVHEDIEAVTQHLHAKGIVTPLLVRTTSGALYTTDDAGKVYRCFTYVRGVSHQKARDPAMCESAAELLGRVHTALADLRHVFKNKRGNIHDTARHMAKLRAVLASHADHDRFKEVEGIARQILACAEELPSLAALPKRIVHGDPKISNVIFGAHEQAIALVDLDTLYPANLAVELGDALRSWCNPLAEDDAGSSIDLTYFEASMRGYMRGASTLMTHEEANAIVTGVETIGLELAARFAADALEESYFGWDKTRFSRSLEHNVARAIGQYAVAESIRNQRAAAQDIVTKLLSV